MREVVLHDGEEELLAHEDDGQLDAQLGKTSSGRTFLLSPAENSKLRESKFSSESKY